MSLVVKSPFCHSHKGGMGDERGLVSLVQSRSSNGHLPEDLPETKRASRLDDGLLSDATSTTKVGGVSNTAQSRCGLGEENWTEGHREATAYVRASREQGDRKSTRLNSSHANIS